MTWRRRSWLYAWLLLACGCARQERGIVLGPLPPRPVELVDDDAGVERPDGSVPCTSDLGCDDGVDCTLDLCLSAGYCRNANDNSRCADAVYCNGIEICDPRLGCQPSRPRDCDDGDPCTIDWCAEEEKSCRHGPRDFDRDGEIDFHCPGGTDCDDFDETRAAEAHEVCGDLVDNDCDEQVDESACSRPSHDTCDDALELASGQTVTADLRGAVSDYAMTCDPDASADLVFTFVLPEPADIRLTARGVLSDGTEEAASLALQARCGDVGSERDCAQGFPADLRARALPSGRYYVVASSYTAHTLVLSLQASPPTGAPGNQSCGAAIDVGAGGRFEGDFIDVRDVVQSSCAIEEQPDLFYRFVLGETSDVELSAISPEGGALAIGVRQGCDPAAAAVRCAVADPAQMHLHELPPGEYAVTVEGPTSHEVPFALDVAFLPPSPPSAGDECRDALPLSLGVPAQASLVDKEDSVDASCQRFGPDAVFALHLDRPLDLDLRLDAGAAPATIALQSTCGDDATELECRRGAPVTARVRNVPAGDYFVVVEALAPTVFLRVDALPRTEPTDVSGNDTCATAFDLPLEGGLLRGDTRFLNDDYHASCGGGTSSPDAVFRLVLAAPRRVVARVDGSFDSVLYRYEDPRLDVTACTGQSPASCDDDSSPPNQGLLEETLEAGTHYYVVDGFKDGNYGRYLLEVATSEP